MLDDLQDMLIFAAVARAGSITRAGETLGLPKSTVSRRLAALEERLGSRLIIKTTRKLTLTESGEAFLERCERLADDVEEARAFASGLAEAPRGTLRVTMPPDLGTVLGNAFATFAERYPEIEMDLDLSPRFVDLVAERFDCAIRGGVLPDSSLVARRLFEMQSGAFASPSYLARHGSPSAPGDLAQHSFIILHGREARDQVCLEHGRRREQVPLHGRIRVNGLGMQIKLAQVGAGMAVLPEVYVQDDLQAGRLVRVLPEWHLQPNSVWIVTPTRRLLPRKTALFIEHLVAALGK